VKGGRLLAFALVPPAWRTIENQRRFAPQQNLYFLPLLQGHGA
jgi:hypothetical protein